MGLPRCDRVARTTLLCIVLAAAALTVGSCTRLAAGRAVLPSPRIGQPVEWEKCRFSADTTAKVPDDARCGSIAVPVDYNDLDGDVAQLAMIRFPATKDKIGSLVINPGGPGESGIEAAVGIVATLPRQVRELFDLVGFDPRGVASSRPAVWCNSDADNDRLRALNQVDYSPAGVERIEDETKAYVQRCVDKNGKEFLANVGTVNVARDLDAIRAGLGDEKLTYLGYSYGTRIGSAYAEAYPQNVRAMILDGAVDPNADPIEEDLRQAAAFQGAFDDYAADCAKEPTCPLGTDTTKSVDVYHSLVDPLVDAPAKTKDP
ncbi:MAG: alpha/beta hydrolase, partial [Mycobacterium sp.]